MYRKKPRIVKKKKSRASWHYADLNNYKIKEYISFKIQ